MSRQKQRVVVPKLRFPEFRDAGPWEVRRLGEIATISNGLTADQSSNSNGLQVTRIETISGGRIDISKVGYVKRMEGVERFRLRIGDILFSHINSRSHIGKTALVQEDVDLYHGMNLLRLQFDKTENNPRFIHSVLNTELFRKSVRARANQAVNQASINQTEVGGSRIAVPSANEQQKIADCLSSLDEVIELHARKLDALKAHKKGLMQQLFPREGETVPRLRFPEFRDAGPWEVKRLGDIGEISTGKTPRTNDDSLWDGDVAFITPTDITDGVKYQATSVRSVARQSSMRILPPGSIVYTCIASIGLTAITAILATTNQQINSIIVYRSYDAEFIYYFLLHVTPAIKAMAAGNAVPIINKTAFSRLPVFLPEQFEEQQKIANCLSSLDEVIELHAQKLAALEAHKKGLMQQLFPQELG